MTFSEFKDTLKSDHPQPNLSVTLKALWYDGKGEWDKAHHEVNHLDDPAAALIHAYLHRKEGDIWNADYWYRKAKAIRPQIPLEEEWQQLVIQFL